MNKSAGATRSQAKKAGEMRADLRGELFREVAPNCPVDCDTCPSFLADLADLPVNDSVGLRERIAREQSLYYQFNTKSS
tara:strand:+ start:375 stop:611 length:237 start_codon:yes stop_codon:yes gene_type:complete